MTFVEPLPANAPMTIYRGDTRIWQDVFTDTITGDPIDMSGYTFRAQIRVSRDDPDVLAVIAVDDTEADVGILVRTLTATEAEKVTGTSAFWDYEFTRTADGFVRTYMSGRVKIRGDVSRA